MYEWCNSSRRINFTAFLKSQGSIKHYTYRIDNVEQHMVYYHLSTRYYGAEYADNYQHQLFICPAAEINLRICIWPI